MLKWWVDQLRRVRRTEEALEKMNARLEARVALRTAALESELKRRMRAEAALRLDDQRLEALLSLHQMTHSPLKDITDFALEGAVRLTESRLGYLAFVNDDQTELTMHSWSRRALAGCAVADKSLTYRVDETGLWGEAVRQRRPIITNEYSGPNPGKKGLPEGHVPIFRHMNVPILEGDRVVAVVGVANKSTPYVETDVRQLKLLTSGMLRIIERKRAEESQLESEGRYHRLAEHSPDVLFRYEMWPEMEFSYLSPAILRVTGYEPEEFYGDSQLAARILLPEDVNVAVSTLEGTTFTPFVIRARHRDGHIVWIEVHAVAVTDELGRTIAFDGIGRDITSRKGLEQQLLRAQRLETAGMLAGQVAHDFNNLLGPLMAYPDLIKMLLPEGHPATRYCDSMVEAAERIAAINEDMLALGRRGHSEQLPVDMNRLVEDAIPQSVRGKTGVQLELSLAPNLMMVNGSSAQLARVLVNLISNGLESMDGATGSPHLVIETNNLKVEAPCRASEPLEAGEYVVVRITDSGCGIEEENLDKLFEPFFTTKPSHGRHGCGLGLSVVRAIVEDHRGRVDVLSEVGKGTTFRVLLPASREELPESPTWSLKGGSERILVVDDEQMQRELAGDLLGRLGYQVAQAASGEEAIAYLRENEADLVILDMVVPQGLNGAECYRKIREGRPDQRAIILSGFSTPELIQQARESGIDIYLRKPVALEALARAVRRGLDGYPGSATRVTRTGVKAEPPAADY
jgi:PAS domain S-box-containing protein